MSTESGQREQAGLLTKLYEEQLGGGSDWYLEHHARRNAILRQVSAFDRYRAHLPEEGTFLDWGCHHGPDACLVRDALGAAPQLYGCDFAEPGLFPVFHRFAALEYTQLRSPFELPYGDETFDVVLGGGVIEHTANDSTSLKELHRVLKEGGLLILTFVPNRRSYTEFLGRRLNTAGHLRLYGRKEVRHLLLHHGFLPEAIAYHQMLPGQQLEGLMSRLWPLNAYLERAWPLNALATNLMIVSRRRSTM